MALFSTLTEDWTTIDEALKWNKWGGGNVTNPAGRLRLTNGPGTTNYYGIASLATYDLTGNEVAIEIVSLPTTVSPTDDELSVGVINLETDANNRYFMSWETNMIICYKVVGGTYTWLAQFAWDANSKYVRIRESGGTVYYDKSANGYTWVNVISVATTGLAVTALYFSAAIGNWGPITNATFYAELDNLNLMPSAPTTDESKMLLMF